MENTQPRATASPASAWGKDEAWKARKGEWAMSEVSAHFIPIMKVWREWSAWSLLLLGDARVPGRVLGKRNELWEAGVGSPCRLRMHLIILWHIS